MKASDVQAQQAPGNTEATASRGALLRFLRALFVKRVGFWRSLVDVTLVGYLAFFLLYPLMSILNSPWYELISFCSLSYFVWAVWRLGPGQGSLIRRGARVLAWVMLLGLISGVLSWVIYTFLPFRMSFLGVELQEVRLPLAQSIVTSLFVLLGLTLPVRTLLVLWAAGRERLRWQLTFSYLLVGILTTLFIPVGLGFGVGVVNLFAEPSYDSANKVAQRIVEAVKPLVQREGEYSSDEMALMLRGLLDGSTRLPLASAEANEESRAASASALFNNVRRITLLRPDTTVLASAGENALAAGVALPANEAGRLALLLDQARSGKCASGRPAADSVADTAVCGMLNEQDALVGLLVVENKVDDNQRLSAAFARILSIALFSTNLALVVLLPISVVILPLALLVGYLLARRLTRRIERLAAATDNVASGNLDRRVEVDSVDEIGRLGNDFNAMAARLEERDAALMVEKERVERLLHANRQLVANVSHELRTPLATLRGYLETLEQDHGDNLPAHDLAVIQNEVKRLTALIDDLFTLARAEAQQLPLTLEPVDVVALTHNLSNTLAPLARRERQIEVVTTLPDSLPLVYADRARLDQVLLNLAQNALRHTPPGGIVAFAGEADKETVTLSVADTGVGIPAEELSLVFERFYRGDSSRARETGGAGLGLALVRELVSAMGGSVTAESTPGRGSRFNVVLRRV